MKSLLKLGTCALSLLTWGSVGCNKVHETDTATAHDAHGHGTAMTPASRTRSASERIAEARCHRERECGNIGPDKTFSSSEDCRVRIEHDWHDDLNARQCPGGINEHELEDCLKQVREEACENPFDTLARITECTAAQICIEQP